MHRRLHCSCCRHFNRQASRIVPLQVLVFRFDLTSLSLKAFHVMMPDFQLSEEGLVSNRASRDAKTPLVKLDLLRVGAPFTPILNSSEGLSEHHSLVLSLFNLSDWAQLQSPLLLQRRLKSSAPPLTCLTCYPAI